MRKTQKEVDFKYPADLKVTLFLILQKYCLCLCLHIVLKAGIKQQRAMVISFIFLLFQISNQNELNLHSNLPDGAAPAGLRW